MGSGKRKLCALLKHRLKSGWRERLQNWIVKPET